MSVAALALSPEKTSLYCSFCGSSQLNVAMLVMGPRAGICDGCVDNAHALVTQRREADRALRTGGVDPASVEAAP